MGKRKLSLLWRGSPPEVNKKKDPDFRIGED